MCSASSASLTAVISTVWPAFTLMLEPLGLTLPLATVTLTVTSACSPDGSAVFEGDLVFGIDGEPLEVLLGVSVGALVGADYGVVPGLDPASSPPPQPARTSMPRAGRSASSVLRESVERMRRGAFQQVGSRSRAREAPSCLTNAPGPVFRCAPPVVSRSL